MMDNSGRRREGVKTLRFDWKGKLRENCLRRVQKERTALLWKIRSNGRKDSNIKLFFNRVIHLPKEVFGSSFRNIVADELEKIKQSTLADYHGISNAENHDILWEYDCLSSEAESEDLMLEMERILYRDLREEKICRELKLIEEEDEYLAQAVFEHMQINDDESLKNQIWCPICKRGQLKETHQLIYCTGCCLQLDLGNDKVNLEFLTARLAQVHMEHLDRGCRASPEFCVEKMFDLTALCVRCRACGTFEIVL